MDKKDPRRLLQYLDSFFGIRNQIKGDPKENVNFTLETLTYMTSHNRADQITNLIVDKMKELQKPIPFGVFECCAGIGGNTLSFLENPNVQWVVSYELRPERREMLKRNIAMYNLAANNRSFIPTEPFTGISKGYKDVVLYFDPPWLPETIKGHESSKDDYILHGIRVGDKTLEEWIAECTNCALIALRVPPGYVLDPVPGFEITKKLLKNSLLYFATPIFSVFSPSAKIQPTTQIQTTQITSTVSESLPPGVKPEEIEWYRGLKKYLFDLLAMILPSKKHRNTMISDEAMKTWVPCFTHESYNPNVGCNYEEIEMVGDHAMEYNFIMYLYNTHPGITRSELSELKSYYISKTFQAQVGLQFGLQNWVRTKVENNTHVFEDLLEAFFGGVNIIADKVFKFGAGTGLCYNLIIKIFQDITIDMKYAKGKPKTQIKETFEKLNWGKAIEHFEKGPNNEINVMISFTPEAMETLRSLGINITSPTIAMDTGNTKKVAFNKAYKTALANIRQMGISEEWVSKMRGNRDLNHPDLLPFIEPVQNKLKQDGYTSFFLKKVQTTKDGKYIQLIATLPDGTLKILATTSGPRDEWEGKKEVLEKYLKS